MRPSATTELPRHMDLAPAQLSMAHQLRPTLPSTTGEAVAGGWRRRLTGLQRHIDCRSRDYHQLRQPASWIAGGATVFTGSSTADSAILIANEGYEASGGAIFFNDASTGGTARVKVFDAWLPGH